MVRGTRKQPPLEKDEVIKCQTYVNARGAEKGHLKKWSLTPTARTAFTPKIDGTPPSQPISKLCKTSPKLRLLKMNKLNSMKRSKMKLKIVLKDAKNKFEKIKASNAWQRMFHSRIDEKKMREYQDQHRLIALNMRQF
jgi:hypothetical protein